MKKHIFYIAAVAFAAFGLQSCLDYTDPGAELNPDTETDTDEIFQGAADSINYQVEISDEGVKAAQTALSTSLRQALGGEYAIRGGKEADYPGPHAYQYQFSFGPDMYAQYFVSPHTTYLGGTLESTYDKSKDFYGGPGGAMGTVKTTIVPLINRPEIDSIPEIKAINLLMFDFCAQEYADVYGPFPYVDNKGNKTTYPFTYNDLRTIYVNIVANIDTIVKCLNYYENNRSAAYKKVVQQILEQNTAFNNDRFNGREGFDTWIRLANSLKLRMAMHIVKVDPEMAKEWAEEAVAGGVVESHEQESVMSPMYVGFTNPLLGISGWGDIRMTASFESLLRSLNHPYITVSDTKPSQAVFEMNNGDLINDAAGTNLKAGTRVVGLRSGVHPGAEQAYAQNMYAGFSALNAATWSFAPLYIMKWAEVDFLRAEGALRGWNMGGTAQSFYERGIENAALYESMMGETWYEDAISDYMSQENPVDYTYVDPMGVTPDMPSVTKIGVKWNDGDSRETKLEKIITQKYIALFPYSNEAWVDLRRTGYPKLFPVLNPGDGDGSLLLGNEYEQDATNIIRRMPFVYDSDPDQKDVEDTGIPALGGEDLQATRLWWDVDAPNF